MNEESIFSEAIVKNSPAERNAYLREACSDDANLRLRVEQLLEVHDHPDSLLDKPACPEVVSAMEHSGMPQQLGDFEIVREIGRGGMGVVYEARQVSLNRRVALKVLSCALSAKAVLRFRREAEAAARLHHTNIVPIYFTGKENRLHYYVMELVDGPSLDNVLGEIRIAARPAEPAGSKKKPDSSSNQYPTPNGQHAPQSEICNLKSEIDRTVGHSPHTETATARATIADGYSLSSGTGTAYFDSVARMIAEVADALAHAHNEGVIHRDIKPSNLLLSKDGHLSINDFGLARMLEEPGMTVTGEFVGSPLYMSPEQIAAGREPVDHRTDVYSLGATLYEMLTLRPPFEHLQRDQVLWQVLHAEPTPPRSIEPRIPLDLQTICQKAMEKKPSQRYQTADKLAEDLRRYVTRHAISARRIGPVGKTVRWCRRNPLVSALSCALLIAVTLSASILAWQRYQERRLDHFLSVEVPAAQAWIGEDQKLATLARVQALQREFPQRPEIDDLLAQIGQRLRITSDPRGAQVAMRSASDPDEEWTHVGTTPLTALIPSVDLHMKIKKPGYDELLVLRWQNDVGQPAGGKPESNLSGFDFKLQRSGGQVYVPETPWSTVPFLDQSFAPAVAPFLIDRHEVTNREFQALVDQGGYATDQYWRDMSDDETIGGNWRDVVNNQFVTQSSDSSTTYVGPKTWIDGRFPPGEADHPVRGVSWYEAAAYARFVGKELPSIVHWIAAAHQQSGLPPHSNIDESSSGPHAIGSQPSVGVYGTFDMAGNVREWCANSAGPRSKYMVGESWRDDSSFYRHPFHYPPLERRDDVGFRCVTYLSHLDPRLREPFPINWRDYAPLIEAKKWEEVSDDFLLSYYRYPKQADLRATDELETIRDVRRIRVEFEPVYEPRDRRVVGFLELPDRSSFRPPYQMVIFFGDARSGEAILNEPGHLEFYRKAGRAVFYPVNWGTYDVRDTESVSGYQRPTSDMSAYVVRVSKDFFRTIDYLQSRDRESGDDEDLIQEDKLAFHGRGWGACRAPQLLSADALVSGEARVKAAVLNGAGMCRYTALPEVDIFNFVPRMKVPVLMVNGREYERMPFTSSQRTMYELFPLQHNVEKKHVRLEGAFRNAPPDMIARDANEWLDQWLGRPTPAREAL